jgi:isochorismate synthase EntC
MTIKKTAETVVKPAKVLSRKVAATATVNTAKKAPANPAVAAKQPKKDPAAAAAKKLKNKVVRDSFTMPQKEYQKITLIKERCLKAGQPIKKSEVLRAGLNALCDMDAAQLKQALAGLEKIKTGRPKES